MPTDPEAYVHRIGRTARAGRAGVAISFCDESEMSNLHAVQKLIKCKIPVEMNHPFHGQAPVKETQNMEKAGEQRRFSGQRSSTRSRFRSRR